MHSPETLRQVQPRIIGIYGARNAGKTCYLAAALMGRCASQLCSVLLEDEASRELLIQHWSALARGELPPATALQLSNIRGSLIVEGAIAEESGATELFGEQSKEETGENVKLANAQVDSKTSQPKGTEKRRYRFSTNDYGGRLAERGDTGQPELSEQFFRWLEESQGLLFFLAVDQLLEPQEAQARLLEVDMLLSRLLQKAQAGHAVSVPIAILVTKWDLESDLSGTPEQEQEKLRNFLRHRAADMADSICTKIEKAADRASLWPVSTFGGHENGRPIQPLRPFNLHEPLVWLLQQSDQLLWEKAHQQAQQALSNWGWKNYSQAIQAYQQLTVYGITRGPLAQKAAEQIRQLRRAQWGRRFKWLGAVIVALGLLVGYGFYWLDTVRYRRLLAELENPSQPFEVLRAEKDSYLVSRNPWAGFLGRKKDVETVWQDYLSQIETEYKNLETRWQKLPPEPSPNHPLRKLLAEHKDLSKHYEGFQQKYQGHHRTNQIHQWASSCQARLQNLENLHQQVQKEVNQIKTELATLPESPASVHERISRYEKLIERCRIFANQVPYCPEETQLAAQYQAQAAAEREKLLGTLTRQEQRFQKLKERHEEIIGRPEPSRLEEIAPLQRNWESFLADCDSFLRDFPNSTTSEEIKKWKSEAEKMTKTLGELSLYLQKAEPVLAKAEQIQNMLSDTEKLQAYLEELTSLTEPPAEIKQFLSCLKIYQETQNRKEQVSQWIKENQEFRDKYNELVKDAKEAISSADTSRMDQRRKAIDSFISKYSRLQERFHQDFHELESLRQDLITKTDQVRFKGVTEAFNKLENSCNDDQTPIQTVKENFHKFNEEAEQYVQKGGQFIPQVQRYQSRAPGELDRRLWREVKNFAQKTPKDYLGRARKAREYLQDPIIPQDQKRHLDEANKEITSALQEEWDSDYGDFRNGAQSIKSLKDVDNAKQLADQLAKKADERRKDFPNNFQLTQEQTRQAEAMQQWRQWAEKLQKLRSGTATIKDIRIQGIDSDFQIQTYIVETPKWGDPQKADKVVGKYKFNEGHYQALLANPKQEVQLTLNDGVFWDTTHSIKVDFLEISFQKRGRITITGIPGYPNASVEFTLEIEGLIPPELP